MKRAEKLVHCTDALSFSGDWSPLRSGEGAPLRSVQFSSDADHTRTIMVSPRFAAGAFLLGALGWASVEQGRNRFSLINCGVVGQISFPSMENLTTWLLFGQSSSAVPSAASYMRGGCISCATLPQARTQTQTACRWRDCNLAFRRILKLKGKACVSWAHVSWAHSCSRVPLCVGKR